MILLLTWVITVAFAPAYAGDYRSIDPGSGIGSTAHDLRTGGGADGWDYRSLYQKKYDIRSMVTLAGVVSAVEEVTPRSGMSPGIALQVETEKESLSVQLGPVWFIAEQDLQIQKGDRVEITGSRVLFGTAPVVMAAEVKKGDERLILRNSNGFPLWPDRREGR